MQSRRRVILTKAGAHAGEDLAPVIACRQRPIAIAGLVPVRLWRLRVSPGHSGPAARVQSCLTRVGHRPILWAHEIPDSGISHRNAASSRGSDTEEGDISPIFAALEHAAGDFTTLGRNPLLGGSSSPLGHMGVQVPRDTTLGFSWSLRARQRLCQSASRSPPPGNAVTIDQRVRPGPTASSFPSWSACRTSATLITLVQARRPQPIRIHYGAVAKDRG